MSWTEKAVVHFQRGDTTYYIDEQGQFFWENFRTPSGKWTLLEAVEFGRGALWQNVVRRFTLDDIIHNRVPWFFKNGKQRCFIKQSDHGGISVQMSPPLRSVWVKDHGYVQGSLMNPFTKGSVCHGADNPHS